jgi:hypothetical protein
VCFEPLIRVDGHTKESIKFFTTNASGFLRRKIDSRAGEGSKRANSRDIFNFEDLGEN